MGEQFLKNILTQSEVASDATAQDLAAPADDSFVPEMTIDIIKKRAIGGVAALTMRRIVLKVISFSGEVILARLLTPEIFGIFTIVSFMVNFFGFFGDVGLGAALIQKKEKLTDDDLKTTFTIQQLLVGVITIVLFVTSPLLSRLYGGEESLSMTWLFRVMSLSLFISSFKVIPSILLERVLKFNLLIIPEILEVISFQVIAIGMALSGYGVWSFVYATIVSRVIGMLSLFILSPWRVTLGLDLRAAKELFRFGLPYQLIGIIGLMKDGVTPIFVGMLLGAQAVGYLNWATTFAFLPLMIIQVLNRITFPAFSRVQHDRILLKKGIEKAIKFTGIVFFPIAFISIGLAKPIVHYVYTDKWLSAMPAFYLTSISILFTTSISATFFNAYYAVGKSKLCLKLMILYLIVDWTFGVPFVLSYGYIGIAMARVVNAFVNLPLSIYLMNRIVKIDILKNISTPLLSASIMGIILYFAAPFVVTGIPSLALAVLVGVIIYTATLYIADISSIREDIRGASQLFR